MNKSNKYQDAIITQLYKGQGKLADALYSWIIKKFKLK